MSNRTILYGRKLFWAVIVALFAGASCAVLLRTSPVHASYGHPQAGTGYFYNQKGYEMGYDVIYQGFSWTKNDVKKASFKSTFENKVLSILNSGIKQKCYKSYSGVTHCAGWSVGAAFIIQTMRGGKNGITDRSWPSASDISDWKKKIDNSGVTIEFKSNYDPSGSENSNYKKPAGKNGDAAWTPYDQSGDAILFVNTKDNSSIYYVIRLDCGNPFGHVNGLPPPPPPPPGGGGGNPKPKPTQPPAATCKASDLNLGDYKQPVPKGGTYNGMVVHVSGPSPYARYPASNTVSASTYSYIALASTGGDVPDWTNVTYDIYTMYTTKKTHYTYTYTYTYKWEGKGKNRHKVKVTHKHKHKHTKTIQNHVAPVSTTVGPCATAACSSTNNFGDTILGSKSTFVVYGSTANASTAPPAPPSGGFIVSIYNADTNTQVWSSGSNYINFSWNNPELVSSAIAYKDYIKTPGRYYVRWKFAAAGKTWGVNGGSIWCKSATSTIGYAPYFSVLGGDIAAGPGFTAADGSCTEGTGAAIKGWNRDGSGGSYYGSGSWLGALALGPITSFASQTNQLTGHGPNNPTGLTFANTTGSSPTYGGSFDKGNWCIPDYAADAKNNVTGSVGPGKPSVDVATLGSGTYEYNGSTGFVASQPIPLNRDITIIVTNGNAFLGSDITYHNYNSITTIPRLRILVTGGDIFVDANVSDLHGFYVAEAGSSNSGGRFYSCTNNAGQRLTDYNQCRRQLKVYGAVAATRLYLDRSYGSTYESPDCTPNGVNSCASEQFIYTPALWLANLKGPNQGTLPFQAVVSLPPVL